MNQDEISLRFYADERRTKNGIVLTDELFRLKEKFQSQNLPFEVEARWRLVETAWSTGISPQLLEVKFDEAIQELYVDASSSYRVSVTSCRDALNGYQKGLCFYCFADITVEPGTDTLADVDHFFPIALQEHIPRPKSNGVWNLVLSCSDCNRGPQGKFARVPHLRYRERLHRRNSFLIDSHHPLRETLIRQAGNTEKQRTAFLNEVDRQATNFLIHRWSPPYEHPAAF